jgi:hypothetical protein
MLTSTNSSSQKQFNQDSSSMADNEKAESEKSQSHLKDDDAQYVTSFKLALIMLTINLSTMVAALNLVRHPIHKLFTKAK